MARMRKVITIGDADRGSAERIAALLQHDDVIQIERRLPIDSREAADAALVLVIVDSDFDWETVAAAAHACDTVVLALEPSSAQAHRALAASAIGYLDLALPDEALRTALFAVLSGEAAYSRVTVGDWLRRRKRIAPPVRLTPRQREILARIALGDTDKEIARRLGIAIPTAHKHVQNLLRRLNVPNRAAAVVRGNGTILDDSDAGGRSA